MRTIASRIRRFSLVGLAAVFLIACATAAPAPQPAAQPKAPEPAKAVEKPAQPAAPAPAAPAEKPAAAKPAAEKPAVAAPQKPAGGPIQLVMGTPNVTSGYYVYAVALGKVLQSKIPGLNVTLSAAGGGIENAKRVNEGTAHFAVAGLVGLYPLYSGLDPAWKDKPLSDARTLWAFDPLAYLWFVREDSRITAFEQLHGKDFNGSGRGTTQDTMARQLVFPALGIEPRWYVGGMDDAMAAVKDRRIVGMGKASAIKYPDALIVDVMTSTRIRMLSWTPQQVQKVRAKYPFLSTVEIPAGVYKAEWNEQPITTWGDGIGMWTVARFDNDLAYKMIKAVIDDHKPGGERTQATSFQALKDFDITELTMTLAPYPLHAGVQKYFQEIGAKIPDHLKSPEIK